MIWIVLACAVSAVFYRLGGAKGYDTKFRDIGCPLTLIALVIALYGLNTAYWAYLLTFGLSWGALSTYWDWLFKKEDNHYAHGLGCGLAGIPLIWCGVPWEVVTVRILICTFGMGLLSKLIKNDVKEELTRGLIFII